MISQGFTTWDAALEGFKGSPVHRRILLGSNEQDAAHPGPEFNVIGMDVQLDSTNHAIVCAVLGHIPFGLN